MSSSAILSFTLCLQLFAAFFVPCAERRLSLLLPLDADPLFRSAASAANFFFRELLLLLTGGVECSAPLSGHINSANEFILYAHMEHISCLDDAGNAFEKDSAVPH